MTLYYIKTENEDIVGKLHIKDSKGISIKNPVTLVIDPDIGIFCRSTLLFGKGDTLSVSMDQVQHHSGASELAEEYYQRYLERLTEQLNQRESLYDDTSDVGDDNDLENEFELMLQAKGSTKH